MNKTDRYFELFILLNHGAKNTGYAKQLRQNLPWNCLDSAKITINSSLTMNLRFTTALQTETAAYLL